MPGISLENAMKKLTAKFPTPIYLRDLYSTSCISKEFLDLKGLITNL